MAEPLKNLFSKTLITQTAEHLKAAWPVFDATGFIRSAGRNLDALELKQRSRQIQQSLGRYLPDNFTQSAAIILDALHPDEEAQLPSLILDEKGIRGWAVMPLCDYVGEVGLQDYATGLNLLKELTKRGTAEVGIRQFILHDQNRALHAMVDWTHDDNFHVRRLASEGCRPRLPWAVQLPALVADPTPLLPILEMLKDDPVEYVRRSVANNLNDVAKDHPDLVAAQAKRWLRKATLERQKLVQHACRTLIKQGHQEVLLALGYSKPKALRIDLRVLTSKVVFGDALHFELALENDAPGEQSLLIDYVVHHRKANGETTPKVFKWKTLKLPEGGVLKLRKSHKIRPITTRVYYPGIHRLEVLINGQAFGAASFELLMPS